jgi:hypothetical protein
MTEALKVFKLAFSTSLFCVAVALLVYSSTLYTDTLSNVRNSYKDREVYQQYNANDSETVPYAELIATLCGKQEFDTVINGIIISKNTFDPESIKTYDIPNINYKKSYVYDNDGNITEIKYTGIIN